MTGKPVRNKKDKRAALLGRGWVKKGSTATFAGVKTSGGRGDTMEGKRDKKQVPQLEHRKKWVGSTNHGGKNEKTPTNL